MHLLPTDGHLTASRRYDDKQPTRPIGRKRFSGH